MQRKFFVVALLVLAVAVADAYICTRSGDTLHGCLTHRECCSNSCDIRAPRKGCCLAEGAVCGSNLKRCCSGMTCTYIRGARQSGFTYCRAYA